MNLRIEHQHLGNRICEMVFFFLYGLVRVLPLSLFHRMAGPSQKESDQESFRGFWSELLKGY